MSRAAVLAASYGVLTAGSIPAGTVALLASIKT